MISLFFEHEFSKNDMQASANINSSIVERLKQLRKQNQLTQSQLAQEIGVTQSIISVVESEKSSVSLDFLRKAANYYNVSVEWLLYGKEKFAELKLGNFVPMVDHAVKADYLTRSAEPEFLETLGMYRIPGYEKGEFLIFAVEGDSMEPTIQEGDKLICSRIDREKPLVEGSIMVVVTKSDIVVKRVFQQRDANNSFLLKSDNPHYRPISIDKNIVQELWKVEAKITTAFTSPAHSKVNRLEQMERELEDVKQKLTALISKASPKEPNKS